MNPHHKNGGRDPSLDDGLDKLGRAYGRLDEETPPDLLDQAVLNQAHRAVEKKPIWPRFSWLHGLATAAVFVLAFSIILNQSEPVPDFGNDILRSEPVLQESGQATRAKAAVPEDEFLMEMSILRKREADAAPASKMIAEEPQLDETESMKDTPEFGRLAQRPAVMAAAPPAKSDSDVQTPAESNAEQRLVDIIQLKQAGDDAWKNELDLFREQYPGYPLPDGLTD